MLTIALTDNKIKLMIAASGATRFQNCDHRAGSNRRNAICATHACDSLFVPTVSRLNDLSSLQTFLIIRLIRDTVESTKLAIRDPTVNTTAN